MKDKKRKIIVECIFGLTILTLLSFDLIFLGLPWLLRERKEDFGNISDAERFFTTMMISFFWFLGMILRVKFCCDELEELESEEQTEIEKKISQKEEIEIEK